MTWRCLKHAVFVLILALPLTSELIAQPDDAPPAPSADAARIDKIKSYAAQFGAPGSAEYTAALQRAVIAADDEALGQKRPDDEPVTRGIGDDPIVTDVDGDPRYQEWLSKAIEDPEWAADLEGAEEISTRTIGGTQINNRSVFKEVALAFEPPATGFCSGVLIDPRTILTAAHCLCGGAIEFAVFGLGVGDQQAHRARVLRGKSHDGVRCKQTGVPETVFWRSLAGNDLAVLRLARALPAQVSLPTPLPDPAVPLRQFDTGNRSLVVVGFGRTERGDTDTKTFAITGILSVDCSGGPRGTTDAEYYGCSRGKEILAKDARLVGPCPGDSGGGAYMLLPPPAPGGQRKAVLVGIVSRSTLQARVPCGDGAIYTLLTPEHIAWIRNASAQLAAAD